MKKAKPQATATDEAAEQLLWDCLAEIPFIQSQKVEQQIIRNPGRPEIVARVQTPGGNKLILAEVKSNGQSRLVREAIRDILKYRDTYADAYGLVIAPSVTPQAAAICKQEGIGYLDFAGNCLLSFDSVFLSKAGRSAPRTRQKRSRAWFSPRTEKVLRILEMHPRRLWTLRELANEAYVTLPQALGVKQHLARCGYLEDSRREFRLARPDLLLDEWSENYLLRRSTERLFASSKSVIEIEVALAAVCQERVIPYALMGFSAAMRYDPLLKPERVSAYVLSDLSQVISALELSEASDKGNVSLWIPYDEGVLRGAQQHDHAKITTPVQTYLDLMGLNGEGERIANSLWENFMRDQWQPQPAVAEAQPSLPAPETVRDSSPAEDAAPALAAATN